MGGGDVAKFSLVHHRGVLEVRMHDVVPEFTMIQDHASADEAVQGHVIKHVFKILFKLQGTVQFS